MPGEYVVRVSTPADYSGLTGLPPKLSEVQAAAAKAKQAVHDLNEEITTAVTGKNFGQRLDDQIKGLLDAGNAANDAQRARFEAMKKAPHWTEKPVAGVGDASGGLGGLAGKAGAAAAAFALIRKGLSEVAEEDRAEVTLRKFGVAAAEATKHAEILSDLELFTGDKVAAAELFGRTINGSTRGLVQFGIFLEEGATRTQRLAALQTLAARGAAAQAAANDTLTGSLKLLWKGIGDSTGEFIKWAGSVTGVTGAIGWLNEKLGFVKGKADEAGTAIRELRDEMAAVPDDAKVAAKALEEVGNAAAAAAGKIDAVNLGLAKAGKTPSDEDIEELGLKKREAEGEDPIVIAKERSRIKAERAEKARIDDAQRAKIAKAEAEEALKNLDAVERRQEADPSRQRASDLARKPKRSAAEQKEYETLLKRSADEKAAINAERQRAQETKRQAEEVEGGLPNRRKAAELERQIDEANISRQEKQRQGEAEMRRGQVTEEMQAKEQARKREEAQRQADASERGSAAEKAIAEKLAAGAERFTNEFGKGKLASDSLAQAQAAAQKRLHDMSADGATENAGDVFDEELGRFIKSDGRGGRKLRPREFRSPADTGGSGLEQLKRMQKKAPGEAGGSDSGNVQEATKALQGAVAGMAQFGALVGVVKQLQTEINKVNAQIQQIDQSITK